MFMYCVKIKFRHINLYGIVLLVCISHSCIDNLNKFCVADLDYETELNMT